LNANPVTPVRCGLESENADDIGVLSRLEKLILLIRVVFPAASGWWCLKRMRTGRIHDWG